MKYLLGIDFGGGASKATLIDTKGTVVAVNTVEYPTLYPELGACEQSAEDWKRALAENTRAVISLSGISAEDILGVCVDSATHTFLLADENFKPLSNAIHWTDTRSLSVAKKLREDMGDTIFAKTYHRPDTIWTLPQLVWYKQNYPDTFEKAKYIFFEKDYIRFLLTGVYCTDYIEAEGSMLFNCNTMEWDADLCRVAGISPDMLPEVKSPTDVVGTITDEASELTGLSMGTKVICGTTDTALEILASGAVSSRDITVKLATAGRICVITDKAYPDKHLVNYSHVEKGLWYPGTATKAAASSYRWYRDTFGGDYEELDKGAENIPIGCEGLIYHPYLKGELTPYADPTLCASFTGVRATHTKAHFSRAVLEGVVMSLVDCKKYLDTLGITYNKRATLIGGGAKSPLWSQMAADALGIELRIAENSDSSLGAALLLGVALGVFADFREAVNLAVKIKKTVIPNPENSQKYEKIFEKYKKIQSALSQIYNEK